MWNRSWECPNPTHQENPGIVHSGIVSSPCHQHCATHFASLHNLYYECKQAPVMVLHPDGGSCITNILWQQGCSGSTRKLKCNIHMCVESKSSILQHMLSRLHTSAGLNMIFTCLSLSNSTIALFRYITHVSSLNPTSLLVRYVRQWLLLSSAKVEIQKMNRNTGAQSCDCRW